MNYPKASKNPIIGSNEWSHYHYYFLFSKTKASKLTWAFMLAPSKYTWPPCSCTRLQTSLKGNCQWNLITFKPPTKYKFVKVNEKDITMMTRHSPQLPLLFFINLSRPVPLKINLNLCFHTSLWCLKRFYAGLWPS